MIKKLLAAAIIVCLLSSCATMNYKYQTVRIISHEPATVIIDSDTLTFDGGRHNKVKTVELEWTEENRDVIFVRGACVDKVKLFPDMKYTTLYVSDVYISNNRQQYIKRRHRSRLKEYAESNYKKGVTNLRAGLPWINFFNSAYERQDRRSKGGFIGISLGLDYFYADNSFINFSGAVITNFPVLVPAPFDAVGRFDMMTSTYGSVSNNHLLDNNNRFSIGYGISFGRDTWKTAWYPDHYDTGKEYSEQESVFRKSNSLGLIIPLYYYGRRSFYMGLIYRPIFLQFADRTRFKYRNTTHWKYQHTISFEFGWRIRLAK